MYARKAECCIEKFLYNRIQDRYPEQVQTPFKVGVNINEEEGGQLVPSIKVFSPSGKILVTPSRFCCPPSLKEVALMIQGQLRKMTFGLHGLEVYYTH